MIVADTPASVSADELRALALSAERKGMVCSPAQIRLALFRAGKLAEAEAIAASNAEAQIVWERAIVIERTSPFIEALKGGTFTDEAIDDLFRTAMEIAL
jgi:hypothetical protein